MVHAILLTGAVLSFSALLLALLRPGARKRLERHAAIPLREDKPGRGKDI